MRFCTLMEFRVTARNEGPGLWHGDTRLPYFHTGTLLLETPTTIRPIL